MTNEQLKDLKERLWAGADQLRANSGLKSTEYAEPILGLIFLRFAECKYNKFSEEITNEYNKIKGTRMERSISEIAIEKCGFYLPDEARYDYLLNLPESENLSQKVKEAMDCVEKYTAELEDTLPKDIYYSVNSEDDPLVLAKLLKIFKDIPGDVELDIFGEIYEYFLGKFALAEGQGGGEFFTPSTVVRYMVEVLAPTEGKILDPACGSGGMFVQTAHYIERHKEKGKQMNLRAFGVEKTAATVKLAKMNLVLNNVRGTIIIGVFGTFLGTVLGWCLGNIKSNRLIFNIKEIHLMDKGDYYKAYFHLNMFNKSDKPKALRNLKICGYKNNVCVVQSEVESSPENGFANNAEREEYEAYLREISLLTINAYESKEVSCKIEFIDFEEDAEFFLEYNDDNNE